MNSGGFFFFLQLQFDREDIRGHGKQPQFSAGDSLFLFQEGGFAFRVADCRRIGTGGPGCECFVQAFDLLFGIRLMSLIFQCLEPGLDCRDCGGSLLFAGAATDDAGSHDAASQEFILESAVDGVDLLALLRLKSGFHDRHLGFGVERPKRQQEWPLAAAWKLAYPHETALGNHDGQQPGSCFLRIGRRRIERLHHFQQIRHRVAGERKIANRVWRRSARLASVGSFDLSA